MDVGGYKRECTGFSSLVPIAVEACRLCDHITLALQGKFISKSFCALTPERLLDSILSHHRKVVVIESQFAAVSRYSRHKELWKNPGALVFNVTLHPLLKRMRAG